MSKKEVKNTKLIEIGLQKMAEKEYESTGYNMFMTALYDLYDYYYLDKKDEYPSAVYDAVISQVKDKKTGLSWELLWDFATALRLMEKVYFYKNDVCSGVCCDSDLNSNKRILIFNPKYCLSNDLNITIMLTMYTENGDSIINLDIIRPFGKKMNTTFLIINRETQYNDDHDFMLMNSVNEIIMQSIVYVMEQQKEKIVNKVMFLGPVNIEG